jgi:hypothetical protein
MKKKASFGLDKEVTENKRILAGIPLFPAWFGSKNSLSYFGQEDPFLQFKNISSNHREISDEEKKTELTILAAVNPHHLRTGSFGKFSMEILSNNKLRELIFRRRIEDAEYEANHRFNQEIERTPYLGSWERDVAGFFVSIITERKLSSGLEMSSIEIPISRKGVFVEEFYIAKLRDGRRMSFRHKLNPEIIEWIRRETPNYYIETY